MILAYTQQTARCAVYTVCLYTVYTQTNYTVRCTVYIVCLYTLYTDRLCILYTMQYT